MVPVSLCICCLRDTVTIRMVGFLRVKLIPLHLIIGDPPSNAENLTAESIVIGGCAYVLLWLKKKKNPQTQKAFFFFFFIGMGKNSE